MGTADKRKPTPRHAKPTMRKAGGGRSPRRDRAARTGDVRRAEKRAEERVSFTEPGENGRIEMSDFGFSQRTGTALYVAMGLVMVAVLGHCVYAFLVG